MLDRVLPRQADNTYRGHRFALVLFGLLLLMKTGMSLGSIFNGHTTASIADGIPLDTYTPEGARTVLSFFALLGLANAFIALIGLFVLVRYRSLVPFMFGIFLLQQASRYCILQFLPIVRVGTPPGLVINLALLGVMVLGLALSLKQGSRPDRMGIQQDGPR